ncbi:ATP synthase F1 subunit delta [Marinilabilia salmonicolor]|uniref:ATP synthase F1 subunit delta n=1 Tax=Marinilabilia salmonicolor TaxID=989 RepID=UPI00029AF8AB|nr:ATP synthase F1 subunit delta [Marinilabilia salmonicolor]
MNRGPITVRYATALFELGKENDDLDRFNEDVAILQEQCLNVRDFCAFLNNPVIKASRKKETLRNVLSKELHPLVMRFVEMVVDKNRESLLPDMLRFFRELYKKHKGIRSVKIITAVAFEKDYLKELQSFLEREFNGPIEMVVKVKPEIIGGMIMLVDDKIVDNSIAHQIKMLKKKIVS